MLIKAMSLFYISFLEGKIYFAKEFKNLDR